MSRQVLLTGADGFIGTRLSARLAAAGWEVIPFSRQDGHIARDPLPAIHDVARVVHLAAASFVPDSWRDPATFYETNVLGTVRVLEWCRAHRCPLTFVSSYVYGHPEYLPIDESHPLSAPNPYAHTKLLGEDLCRFYSEKFQVRTCVVRPFNIYGPGQLPPFLIPTLIQQALDPSVPAISVADLRPSRDYVFVDDLVDLLASTCEADAQGVYNAASGESYSIAAIVDLLAQFGCGKPVVSRDEFRPGEILEVRGDSTRARNQLAWSPATPFSEGLRRCVEFFRRDV